MWCHPSAKHKHGSVPGRVGQGNCGLTPSLPALIMVLTWLLNTESHVISKILCIWDTIRIWSKWKSKVFVEDIPRIDNYLSWIKVDNWKSRGRKPLALTTCVPLHSALNLCLLKLSWMLRLLSLLFQTINMWIVKVMLSSCSVHESQQVSMPKMDLSVQSTFIWVIQNSSKGFLVEHCVTVPSSKSKLHSALGPHHISSVSHTGYTGGGRNDILQYLDPGMVSGEEVY